MGRRLRKTQSQRTGQVYVNIVSSIRSLLSSLCFLDDVVFCLDKFFFVLVSFPFDTFDQSLVLLDGGLFNGYAIFCFDLFNLLLNFCFGHESLRESLEVGCEQD